MVALAVLLLAGAVVALPATVLILALAVLVATDLFASTLGKE
jgi:hypothetical protein